MSSEFEEIVLHTDAANVEQLFPDLDQCCLNLVSGNHASRVGDLRRAWWWKFAAVDLPVSG